MAKNQVTGTEHRNGAVRDGSRVTRFRGNANSSRSNGRPRVRQILFPTEPSTIGNEKIDRAIERVTSRRK